MSNYLCPRCAADPQPTDFGSARRCAFQADGSFTDDNWNCATEDVLLGIIFNDDDWEERYSIGGNDESIQIIPVYRPDEDGFFWGDGWLVMTRYKQRGKTSNAYWIGDSHDAEPLTLQIANDVIGWHEQWLRERT